MRRAARMDVNGRAEFRETPGGAGVIEMNVTEKHVPDILGGESRPPELFGQVDEGRLRSGVEEHKPIAGLERGRGDDAGPAELPRIENMDGHGTQCRLKLCREKAASSGVNRSDASQKKISAVARQFR